MGKMSGCKDCFYALKDSSEFPCVNCKGYDYYLHKDVYKEETDNKAWAKVVEGLNGLSKEDMPVKGDPHFYAGVHQLWPKFESNYDTVNKPKHYMLFEEQGIEVRDVIEKLVQKIDDMAFAPSPMVISDYVQMMQYLMRFMDKNGVEDLKKARWYLDKLIESY
jgi:hypothetical protein